MNIPVLPVDSLYKFLALFGLVIMLFCFYLTISTDETIQEKLLNLRIDIAKARVEVEFLQLQRNKIDQLVKSMTNGITASDILKEGQIPVEVTTDEYKKILQEFERMLHDGMVKQAEQGVLLDEIGALDQKRRFYHRVFPVFFSFGLVLSGVGFVLWYRKIQRYQDQIIREQSTRNKD